MPSPTFAHSSPVGSLYMKAPAPAAAPTSNVQVTLWGVGAYDYQRKHEVLPGFGLGGPRI